MKVNSLPLEEFTKTLRNGDFRQQTGPFTIALRIRLDPVARLLYKLYGDCQVVTKSCIADFHLRLERPKGIRRWARPQANLIVDGQRPFAPFPLDTAFPLLEWGFNWCVATRAQHYLMLHAAVVEKNGQAIVLPAWPGAGKSTLCAAMVHRGWRLLSDEFGLVRPNENRFVPLPRCIPLKNESIEVMRQFAPDAVIGPTFPKTRKGAVAHLKPPTNSAERAHEEASAAFVIFPRYNADGKAMLKPFSKARAFMKLAGNSFNYELLGADGFRSVASIIRSSDCYLFHYGDLEKAVTTLDGLVA